jgi:hypothetical protein
MELETLAWQDSETFRSFVETAGDHVSVDLGARLDAMENREEDDESDLERVEEPLRVTNEFADARVGHLRAADGDRIEIEAPKLGYRAVLTPTELESVTWQTTATFTEFLETPFGPDGHH